MKTGREEISTKTIKTQRNKNGTLDVSSKRNQLRLLLSGTCLTNWILNKKPNIITGFGQSRELSSAVSLTNE